MTTDEWIDMWMTGDRQDMIESLANSHPGITARILRQLFHSAAYDNSMREEGISIAIRLSNHQAELAMRE